MREPYPNVSAAAYPSQFQFKQGSSGRRVESVLWERHCDQEACAELGRVKAQADRERRLSSHPETLEEDLPTYVGFFGTEAGRVRGTFCDDDYYCEPGVFSVEHEPENGVFAHAHIVLNDGFLDSMRQSVSLDLGPNVAARLSEKQARQHAIHMLVRVFERLGLSQIGGQLVPLAG
ncbi:hypothetical protein [Stenotrophomonas sp.]|uniref:hypothetical protein n=1 Tax=Stenotrophomonas sp. TaxID=69392 RepID=UPI0028AF225F|nr:hypothetical protein [Stenotrophomonas sp.]